MNGGGPDFLDACLDVEDSSIDAGRRQGHRQKLSRPDGGTSPTEPCPLCRDGQAKGVQEGLDFGVRKGFELGSELGFYIGLVEVR